MNEEKTIFVGVSEISQLPTSNSRILPEGETQKFNLRFPTEKPIARRGKFNNQLTSAKIVCELVDEQGNVRSGAVRVSSEMQFAMVRDAKGDKVDTSKTYGLQVEPDSFEDNEKNEIAYEAHRFLLEAPFKFENEQQ